MLPKTKYARSDDVRIAYQISGEGAVDVVWAPGTMSHLDLDWEIQQRARFFERFGRFCRLIRFDKRGTGLSDRPVKMATLEERTDDIRAVMDDVGIESANIFGVSEGGSMACLFAATYPQRVNSLLVWGAQARWIASPDHPWGQTQEEHDQMVAMIQDDWPSLEYITGPGAGVGKDADPAYIEAISRYMRAAASPSAVRAYEIMNGQIDTRPILPSIHAPTWVMNRTGDPCARVEAARDMASRIPGAKFKEYPGNSHSMMLDDMETILADIQEFITGERPVDSSDRILATVLFLDIASSTERAAVRTASTRARSTSSPPSFNLRMGNCAAALAAAAILSGESRLIVNDVSTTSTMGIFASSQTRLPECFASKSHSAQSRALQAAPAGNRC